jgi:F0F1-type ATP synthase membrane subunit b/b'
MSGRQFAFVFTVVLVLAAGVVVGRLWTRLPLAAPPPPGQERSWIADQLDLTTDQRKQMDAIWAETKQKMAATFDQHHSLDHERDAAIRNLLNDEQKAAYDKIQAEYRAKRTQMDKQRDQLIHDAEERSRALLDDSQQKQWDELTKLMHQRHGPHGPPGSPGGPGPGDAGRPGGPPDTVPTTRPDGGPTI